MLSLVLLPPLLYCTPPPSPFPSPLFLPLAHLSVCAFATPMLVFFMMRTFHRVWEPIVTLWTSVLKLACLGPSGVGTTHTFHCLFCVQFQFLFSFLFVCHITPLKCLREMCYNCLLVCSLTDASTRCITPSAR